jgi:hypothetical protein
VASLYANGKRALGVCDVCGFTYKLASLKSLVVKDKPTGLLACHECWNPSQPQLKLGEFPVYDPQALRNPRVDSPQYAQSRALLLPVLGLKCLSDVGTVTIVIT